jgi:hypothetical protein
MLTRTQIFANTARWAVRSVPYAQFGTTPQTGHRPDCSGYASMCLGLPTPGEDTVTLVTKGLVTEIDSADILPGDLIGRMGPGTSGNAGHVQVYIGRSAAGGYIVMEQTGGGSGPHRNTYSGIGSYKVYRFTGLEEGDDDMAASDVWAWRMAGTNLSGVPYDFSAQEFMVGTNEFVGAILAELRAGKAADAARDAAALAAIEALAKAGGVDAAPVVAAVKAVGDELRAELTKVHAALAASQADLAASQAEVSRLRSQIASGEEAPPA